LRAEGKSLSQIARELGRNKSNIAHLLRRQKDKLEATPKQIYTSPTPETENDGRQLTIEEQVELEMADWPYHPDAERLNREMLAEADEDIHVSMAVDAEQWRSSLNSQALGRLRSLCRDHGGLKSPDFRTWKEQFFAMPAAEAEDMINRCEWQRKKRDWVGRTQEVAILFLAGDYVEALDAFRKLKNEQKQECRELMLDLAHNGQIRAE
jgi:hypothetical protein